MKRKQFAVIGIGRFGASVAACLINRGYEVLAIDVDEERLRYISDMVTHTICADATEDGILKSMGISNFDAVVVAIGHDLEASVLTTVLLKELGVSYIVAKAQNELHGKMLEKIGADRVIYPERDMGVRLAHSLISAGVLEYIELSADLSVVEVAVPLSMVGKKLSNANLRSAYGVNLLAISRGDSFLVTLEPEEILRKEDILLVIGQNTKIQRLEEMN